MIEYLHLRLKPLLETTTFNTVFSVLVFINPLALLPQLWTALTAPSVAGVSIGMLLIFCVIQIVIALQGIRVKSTSMFLSMAISAMESAAIIVIVLLRG